MAASTAAAAAVAGTAAVAAYLNAKYHLYHDLSAGSLNNVTPESQRFMAERQAANKLLIYHSLEEHAQNSPNSLFLEFEERSWTYGEFYQAVQRVGNWLINDLGLQKDEMVALDAPNSAEYLMVWLAVDAVGGRVAFINYHLTGTALVHCVSLCKPRVLLAERGDPVQPLVAPHEQELKDKGITIAYFDQQLLESLTDTTPLPLDRQQGIEATSTRRLVYTSGTTGLPKGVELTVGRELNTARRIAKYLRLTPKDKFYTCLPLYHGAAQGLCTTPTIFTGSSMRLGRKFSHKTFWQEVHDSGANRLQYVGELCRYLVNAPPHPLEKDHKLEMAWGNGMRPDVWETFRTRFNIPTINELYAATDGLGPTFNWNNGEFSRNAIGVRGIIWNWYNDGKEVRARIDPETEDIVRGPDGFVVLADTDEPGEVIHRVEEELKAVAFKGYYGNSEASEKRWMYDVFQKGDRYFRSGDVQRVDADGRVFFVDRLGDTFRWRSENVSTNEVSDVVGTFPQVAESNVYGVSVPHADGRCGCATIVPQPPATVETLDLAGLARHVMEKLPRYAVPLFLRVAPQLSYTGTFKIQKGQAKREGVNLDLIEKAGSKDKIFWLPPGSDRYVPYTRNDWEALQSGKVKL